MAKYVKKAVKLKPGPVPTGRVRDGIYIIQEAHDRLKAMALAQGVSKNTALERLILSAPAELFGRQEEQ